MSEPIVILAEAKAWLRIDQDYEDSLLQLLIDAATEAVLVTADAYDPSTAPPARLKLAVLAHIERAWHTETVDAPEGNARLLMPLRTLDV